ncbi:uncharacterized protein LAJ45_02787 [Morchella importuna]|uniref:uncharacterized protein n=1 Tax=Morchella importuna TaxID=1174673 RepID=UPI001E8CD942|nr:uncharacterized protein LAJ45_02787 [Morchella importuna]KAH8153200.1 hypothetical protein LAJ45_02787 [Morchella importuna]
MDPPPPTPSAPHLPKEKHDSNGYNDPTATASPTATTPPPHPASMALPHPHRHRPLHRIRLPRHPSPRLRLQHPLPRHRLNRLLLLAQIQLCKHLLRQIRLALDHPRLCPAPHAAALPLAATSPAALRPRTLWWVAVTQWFFGAPIMDRTFTLTGGACRAVMRDPGAVKEVLGEKVLAATSAACKLAGGRWRGGHDLSGHTFLLTHASLFLWSEVMPVLRGVRGWRGWRTGGVVGLLAVWWWMLLMTGCTFIRGGRS